MVPGSTANAATLTPLATRRSSNSAACNTFASFDCAYAAPSSYPIGESKFVQSKPREGLVTPRRTRYVKWCAPDDTKTILPCAPDAAAVFTHSSSNISTNRKCPKWFTPKCVSLPSQVSPNGSQTTPAQHTMPFRGNASAQNVSAKVLVFTALPRSKPPNTTNDAPTISPRIFSATDSPFSRDRHASTTRAPLRAKTLHTSPPSPPVAPVTRYVSPPKSRPSLIVSAVLVALNAKTSSVSGVPIPSDAASTVRQPPVGARQAMVGRIARKCHRRTTRRRPE
mmetsp:Transcript_8033/g.30078  ORF Transcript_8033/g.30078 Transcript_8033/m.30078 type:complete len:281 (+) Transcript_8033:2232-3074(+)